MEDVESFCTTYGLTDKLEVMKKGALVAQSPADYDKITELDESDKVSLHREITRRCSKSVVSSA
jgi:hypothetical protein